MTLAAYPRGMESQAMHEQVMNDFGFAIRRLKTRRRVTRRAWGNREFVELEDGKFVSELCGRRSDYALSAEDVLAEDWSLHP